VERAGRPALPAFRKQTNPLFVDRDERKLARDEETVGDDEERDREEAEG
jgi:hypothetical protein